MMACSRAPEPRTRILTGSGYPLQPGGFRPGPPIVVGQGLMIRTRLRAKTRAPTITVAMKMLIA